MSKGEALRQAKLSQINSHPFFWSHPLSSSVMPSRWFWADAMHVEPFCINAIANHLCANLIKPAPTSSPNQTSR
ncbi:hypothetical protein [Iningainema tapete]|uniref:Uncharacterized protein n=1 Tax=Iningainema tapete BLCC-T55 TaxID=2748662 RepID=A0A8J7BZ81_9CYAN|nr:hypothetical protein [Iningainema tapete]MBD2777047.1 hypothetical protein [Iningainema tapete BLCC-T55]